MWDIKMELGLLFILAVHCAAAHWRTAALRHKCANIILPVLVCRPLKRCTGGTGRTVARLSGAALQCHCTQCTVY